MKSQIENNIKPKNKLLWYIARADLSKPGDAPALHSREDVRGLRKCGWNAVLYAGASGPVKTPEDVEEVVVQKMGKPLERLLFELKMVYRLILLKPKPDFVLFRGPTNLILIGVALVLLRIPFGVELNGVLNYRYKEGRLLRHWIERAFHPFFMKFSRVIVGVTEELSAQAAQECRKGTILVTARNGVNFNRIRPVKTRPTQLDIKIGFLGKAYQARGLDQALEMVKELRQNGVNTGFLAIGGGPETKRLQLKACALGLKDVVEFRESVEPEEMANQVADCCVMWASFEDHYSLHLSGLSPLKIWTYLAIAKPVFLRDHSRLNMYHGVPGLLWAKGSSGKELADELMMYWRRYGKEGLLKLGEAGRRFVESNVSWEKHAKIISEAVKKALPSKESLDFFPSGKSTIDHS